jgi:hypothetical protein
VLGSGELDRRGTITGLPNAEFIFASRTLDRRVILRYGVNTGGGGGGGVKISVNFVGVLGGKKWDRWSNDSWFGVLVEDSDAVVVSEISSSTIVEVVEGE